MAKKTAQSDPTPTITPPAATPPAAKDAPTTAPAATPAPDAPVQPSPPRVFYVGQPITVHRPKPAPAMVGSVLEIDAEGALCVAWDPNDKRWREIKAKILKPGETPKYNTTHVEPAKPSGRTILEIDCIEHVTRRLQIGQEPPANHTQPPTPSTPPAADAAR